MRQPLRGILALVLGFVIATAAAAVAQMATAYVGLALPPAAIGAMHLAAWFFFGWLFVVGLRGTVPTNQEETSALTAVSEEPTPDPAQDSASSGVERQTADHPEPPTVHETPTSSATVRARHASAFLVLAAVLSFGGGYIGTLTAQNSVPPTVESGVEQPTTSQLKHAAEERLSNPAWIPPLLSELRPAGQDLSLNPLLLSTLVDMAVDLCNQALDGHSIVDHITRKAETLADADAEAAARFTLIYASIWSATSEMCLQPSGSDTRTNP